MKKISIREGVNSKTPFYNRDELHTTSSPLIMTQSFNKHYMSDILTDILYDRLLDKKLVGISKITQRQIKYKKEHDLDSIRENTKNEDIDSKLESNINNN